MNKEATVGKVTDKLTHFLVEPFTPHEGEYYVAIKSEREGDIIYFSTQGGVDIESVWDTVAEITSAIWRGHRQGRHRVQAARRHAGRQAEAVRRLRPGPVQVLPRPRLRLPRDQPLCRDRMAWWCPWTWWPGWTTPPSSSAASKWGDIAFPAPFGRRLTQEEAYIKEMDEKSGASLKLTILNPKGRVWTMVAGGGASVIYTDTIVDLGYGQELANYGEYSGNPTTSETYQYAKTILDLMTREKDPQGRPKFLLIGGGIANFTDVAKTFTGITWP